LLQLVVTLVIEPSGVGKLSDVTTACLHWRVKPMVQLHGRVTVIDVKRCQMYVDNFGEFFIDQLACADVVVLSRVDLHPERAESARSLIRKYNERAAIFAWPLDVLSGEEILSAARFEPGLSSAHEDHGGDHDEDHDSHDEDHHGHGHAHRHAANEAFQAVTVHPSRTLTVDALNNCMARVDRGEFGRVIRAKGILATPEGTVNLQYVPGSLEIHPCKGAAGGALCLIGEKLNREGLDALLEGA
jgi:G3E family GTPase